MGMRMVVTRGRLPSEYAFEFGEPGAVGGHPGQSVEFVDRDPFDRPVVVGVRFAADVRDEVGAQGRRRVEGDVDAEAGADGDVDTELLVQLAGERSRLGFACRDLAAGQLPQTGEFGRPVALGHQQRGPRNQCTRNDDLTAHYRRRYTVESMAVLSDEQVDAALPDIPGWERAGGALRRSIKFPAFLDGIDAVRRVAEKAEEKDHHPDIDIRWRTVTFALVTHSVGGITENDLGMAREINAIVG